MILFFSASFCLYNAAGNTTCSPNRCKIKCRFGFQRDKNGCEICKCNRPPCPQLKCISCQEGFRYRYENNCQTCDCIRNNILIKCCLK
jgi:hypothetical protein